MKTTTRTDSAEWAVVVHATATAMVGAFGLSVMLTAAENAPELLQRQLQLLSPVGVRG
jgi:hypothetical protein